MPNFSLFFPIIQTITEPQPGPSGTNNGRRDREPTPDRSSSSGQNSIALSGFQPPPDSPRRSPPRGSPTRGSQRDSPPPRTRGQPSTEEPIIEDPHIQLENAWTSTLSDMAVDAKNGTLSSRTLTNELVSMNLQFMAQEKGPKPAQQRRLEVNGVSTTYLNILTQKLDVGSHFLGSEGGVFR